MHFLSWENEWNVYGISCTLKKIYILYSLGNNSNSNYQPAFSSYIDNVFRDEYLSCVLDFHSILLFIIFLSTALSYYISSFSFMSNPLDFFICYYCNNKKMINLFRTEKWEKIWAIETDWRWLICQDIHVYSLVAYYVI